MRLQDVPRARGAVALLLLAACLATGAVAWRNVQGEQPVSEALPTTAPDPGLVQRGAYLARAGNCAACHTARGGAAFAGGKAVATPFGTVYAGNLTPDPDTGLGKWSADHFWRALHHGRSRDGRLLYPAFPYTEYTRITREDSDALYAFLRTVPAVKQATPPHELRFPYNQQAAVAVWRALFFTPGEFRADPAHRRSGTAEPTWCVDSATAKPVMRRETHWAPPLAARNGRAG